MLAHNYRRVPALALARRLVADGRIGQVRQVRLAYLQDWLARPTDWNWRLEAARQTAALEREAARAEAAADQIDPEESR